MPPDSTLLKGDALEVLKTLAASSVQTIITSPPYFHLRNYGVAGQIGLEETPDLYVEKLVEIFREARRVLRDDGTLWVNMGDSYAGSGGAYHASTKNRGISNSANRSGFTELGKSSLYQTPAGFKPKDKYGIPWRVALALQADGWYLRQDIIWSKPDPLPEAVLDRPSTSHEYIFLFSKSENYFYDYLAVLEPVTGNAHNRGAGKNPKLQEYVDHEAGRSRANTDFQEKTHLPSAALERNRRSVWTISTAPYRGAHFATYPEELVEICILAGTSARGACPSCDAPWRRIVEKHTPGKSYLPHQKDELLQGKSRTSVIPKEYRKPTTLGWEPSCEHHYHALPPVPCVVLDPFVGSGTTVAVALRLGRSGIGIDLKDQYLDLARKRIQAETVPFPGLEKDCK